MFGPAQGLKRIWPICSYSTWDAGGRDLFVFLQLGVEPQNVVGIDSRRERVVEAQRVLRSARFVHGDAGEMDLPSATFDIVFESMMFVQIVEEARRNRVATEMLRVCGPRG